MLKDGLGLSESSQKHIIEEVNIIVNCAASVDFNAKLDEAISINVRGTLRMMELAKKT